MTDKDSAFKPIKFFGYCWFLHFIKPDMWITLPSDDIWKIESVCGNCGKHWTIHSQR